MIAGFAELVVEKTFSIAPSVIEATAMPDPYRNQVCILCNDCNNTCKTIFLIFGLKCAHCNSYNSRRNHLKRIGNDLIHLLLSKLGKQWMEIGIETKDFHPVRSNC